MTIHNGKKWSKMAVQYNLTFSFMFLDDTFTFHSAFHYNTIKIVNIYLTTGFLLNVIKCRLYAVPTVSKFLSATKGRSWFQKNI